MIMQSWNLIAVFRGSGSPRQSRGTDAGNRVRQRSNTPANFVLAAIISAMALAAAGCRDNGEGRVLMHEPGVYKGKADAQLTKKQARAVRERANLQRF
jgi:hypothetical protein